MIVDAVTSSNGITRVRMRARQKFLEFSHELLFARRIGEEVNVY